MKKYIPSMYKKSIFDINYDKLKSIGIKCLIFDLDNTIALIDTKLIPEEVKTLFIKLKKDFNIVITGKLKVYKNRDSLQKDIEANGGKVVGSVSSKTNYLINNDPESTSSKNTTAKKLGIPIITEENFIKKFLT